MPNKIKSRLNFPYEIPRRVSYKPISTLDFVGTRSGVILTISGRLYQNFNPSITEDDPNALAIMLDHPNFPECFDLGIAVNYNYRSVEGISAKVMGLGSSFIAKDQKDNWMIWDNGGSEFLYINGNRISHGNRNARVLLPGDIIGFGQSHVIQGKYHGHVTIDDVCV